MAQRLLALAGVLLACGLARADKPQVKPQDIPLAELGEKYRLVGKLGIPLGEVVTVQGVVVDGPFKGYEGGPNLRVQRIGGRPTQADIRIRLVPYFNGFGKEKALGEPLPKLEFGKIYEFEGYETGGFVGVPNEAWKKAGIMLQTTGHYFRLELIVYKGKRIERIDWTPADFTDREALLAGKAVNRDGKAYIDGDGWRLLTDPAAAWSKEIEGKAVEGFGTVKKAAGGEFRLDKGTTRLVKLSDQLGRAVELRGTAWSMNGHWWFEYRGMDLYVEGMKDLPGWKGGLHGCPVLITGTLDEADLPAIDQLTLKPNPDKKKQFIVRKAALKPLDALLAPERPERD